MAPCHAAPAADPRQLIRLLENGEEAGEAGAAAGDHLGGDGQIGEFPGGESMREEWSAAVGDISRADGLAFRNISTFNFDSIFLHRLNKT